MRPPDASQHNPDPAYLRQLLGDRNPKATAAQLGLSVRTFRYYLSTDPAAPRAPYCVQYALEQLAEQPPPGVDPGQHHPRE